MTPATIYPKILRVEAKPGKTLWVKFVNGEERIYDCNPLLHQEAFRSLQNEAVFRCAHADAHGYGVIWNDNIDLAESEIWVHGRPAEQSSAHHGH